MKRLLTIGAVSALILTATPAFAAPPGPTGTIEIASTAMTEPAYGAAVTFETTLEGKIAKQADIYVTVVCDQDGDVVYQWSKRSDGGQYTFDLVDQAGQGLDWNGQAARCEAWLIYSVKTGRSSDITRLDGLIFDVVGS